MFESKESLKESAIALIESEPNLIANLANLSSLIFHSMPDLNWSGFYLWDKSDQELILGPFQGKPACIRIKPNRGVCGKAFTSKQSQLVSDVHQFPGHISCDVASRSELVIPLIFKNECLGVLDLDSPSVGRFTSDDLKTVEDLVHTVVPMMWKNQKMSESSCGSM